MFEKARLQLTIWYLLILTLITVMLSTIIYYRSDAVVARGLEAQRAEIFHRQFPHVMSLPLSFMPLNQQTIQNSMEEVKTSLIVIDFIILILAGFGSYFLAGKTLEPIRHMIDEQNRFVADASHELLTPLTNLHAEIEVVIREKKLSPEEAKRIFSSNLEEVVLLESLSVRLLQLAEYKKLNQQLPFTHVSITELLDTAWKQVSSLANSKHITLHKEIKDAVKIHGDRESLFEVFVILFDNAVKYSHEGESISVSVTLEKKHCVIQIIDQGIGIAEKDIPHVFDRFYRSDKARTKNTTTGFGLGLSIAKHIIDLHKGTIVLRNNSDQGITATIKLPA